MRTLYLLAFLLSGAVVPLFAQPEYFPLRDGNIWTYRERGGSHTFQIQVGTPAVINSQVYYRLTGYVDQPVWARFGEDGALYYHDEDKEADVLLVAFQPASPGGWYEAPLRMCSQELQPQGTREELRSPSGYFPAVLSVRYRQWSCADAGIQEERFAPNIGMLQRTVESIRGPRTYDLVSADLGTTTLQADSGAGASVTLREIATGAREVTATLRLRVQGANPITLHYLSSQEFDMALRNSSGTVVWQLSAGQVYLPVIQEKTTLGQSWQATVPLANLPPGRYELETWVASGYDRHQFSATAPVVIPSTAEPQ